MASLPSRLGGIEDEAGQDGDGVNAEWLESTVDGVAHLQSCCHAGGLGVGSNCTAPPALGRRNESGRSSENCMCGK